MNIKSNIHNIESGLNSWYPCDILRCSNFLYRVYALRNHNMREMQIIWEVVSLIIWAYAIKLVINSIQYDMLSEGLQKVLRGCLVIKKWTYAHAQTVMSTLFLGSIPFVLLFVLLTWRVFAYFPTKKNGHPLL